MDLIQQVKGYSDSREEEEEFDEEVAATAEEEEEDNITIPREESSSRLHEQDAATSNYNLMIQRKQQHQKLELLDLSLGSNKNKNNNEAKFQQGVVIGGGCGSTTTPNDATCSSSISSTNNEGRISSNNNNVEKEHMFDKVVTPSDVGKLNRLVIPKQHAEKYFPLDSSSNEKGLLLNFEDRNGKLWRFRYSYWNSSQSYVMTKGWSRFVKDKKLDSGDIVSFKRGVGDLDRHRLYIDWKRRSDNHHHAHNNNNLLLHDPSQTTIISPLFLPNHYSIPWGGGRLYSLPSPNATTPTTTTTMLPPRHNNDHFHHSFNYNSTMYNTSHQQELQFHQQYYDGCSGSGLGYLRSTPSMSMHQIGDQSLQDMRGNIIAPMIIDSVPVTYQQNPQNGGVGIASSSASNSGKMLRLFGVNMECSSSSPNDDSK
ncbi:hypothetical protein TanjilG_21565 [Lupinus angustifolius]|uniref:TF-B3 domain-containing protein n=1 Tax=Lupinus angustifolius TaxID=3871 RepID=A0A4P1QUP2_LUPAN|nr:PREDICTED: B3 domain-containing transcription factor NGA1-like [Lupinus angustifolius]OIV95175.1 hypothetical protein TanjilG_21565 [Lupinus angustifolius]